MNHAISLPQAIEMTTAFRNQKDKILNPALAGKNILPTCETFDRAIIDTLLAQPGCVRIRIYYGLQKDLSLHAILVGVNEKDEDMLPSGDSGEGDEEGGSIAEESIPCPPTCPPPSPLNH
jgi:hypothetical protein